MSGTATTSGDNLIDLRNDLAQVNLLRIRGDISSAKTLCLSVLKRFPESIDAHVMMGDLHAEQADLKPASEWYSLALDMDRNTPGVGVKLARVQAAMEISNQASTNRGLILAGKRNSPLMYAMIFASLVAISSVAYFAGSNAPTTPPKGPAPIQQSIVAPSSLRENQVTPVANGGSNSNGKDSRPAEFENKSIPLVEPQQQKPGSPGVEGGVVAVDQTLLEQIREKTSYRKNLVSIIADPRDNSLIVTYNVSGDEHGRYIGAILADVAMEYESKVLQVTLRGVRNGMLLYMADVERSSVETVENELGADVKDLTDHQWIDKVLTNEFFKYGRVGKDPQP